MPPEHARLAAWRAFALRDTASSPAVDRVTALAADLFDAPVASIGLIDDASAWLKSCIGVPGGVLPASQVICGQAVALCEDGVFVLEDAARDARFRDHPAVVGVPHVSFYAGAALVTRDGLRLGMLYVADRVPRARPGARALDRLRGLAGLVVDELELRLAHHESENARRLLELAESVARIGHWRYDLRRHELSWSDEVYRMHGVTRENHNPDPASTLTFCHPEDRANLELQIRAAFREKRTYACERRLVRADGSVRRVISKGGCECDEHGRVTAMFGVLQDVTEQATTVAALRHSEARHRLLVEQATDIIVSLDLAGRITLVSPSVASVLGYRPAEILGRMSLDFIHPKDRRKLRLAFTAMPRQTVSRHRKPIEFQARHRDGRWVWLESHPALVLDPAPGRATGFMDIIRDISRRKAQHAEIAAAHAAAEAAANAKSELLAVVSHEIRTPLNAIIGLADLFGNDAALTREQHQKLLGIRAAGRGLLALANDILHLSKLEAGHVRLDKRPFSPLDVIQDAAALMRPEADRKGLRLIVDALGAPDRPLIGDPDRVHQILLNFLSNAIKFTSDGEVRIRLTFEPAGAATRLCIAVQDSGIGIAADQLLRLFRPYAQAEVATAARFDGTGLGLAISKRLAEAMNGSIAVQSRVDAGSCFVLTLALPVAETEAAETGRRFEPDRVGALHGLRLLVAEDVAVNQRLVRLMLDPLGCTIDMVENGARALEAVQNASYALILMDMRMPVLDGIEATRRIRGLDGGFARLPIVAMTANAFPEEIARCHDAGMNDHLVKPFGARDLTAMVVKWTLGQAARCTAAPDEGAVSLAACQAAS